MPPLSRVLLSPLVIDVRAGAVDDLGSVLSDRRISANGRVAVAVGPGLGEEVLRFVKPSLRNADFFKIRGGSLLSAAQLQQEMRAGSSPYDALVGIGGGRTLDVTKYTATHLALPMVSVATNLAHDGIASPIASLDHEAGRGSFGVTMPIAVIVDLNYVRRSPRRMVASGIGDVLSNLSAIEDWLLANRERGEPVDGLAIAMARTAAEAVLGRSDTVDSDQFLTVLAEALVLSGLAMAAAGSSRPCSGSDHKILHAIDALFPDVSNHGELAGVGALFAFALRGDWSRVSELDRCFTQHGLPRLPSELGLTDDQFALAVHAAPSTRPDRYTILEHLDLNEAGVGHEVRTYVKSINALSSAH